MPFRIWLASGIIMAAVGCDGGSGSTPTAPSSSTTPAASLTETLRGGMAARFVDVALTA